MKIFPVTTVEDLSAAECAGANTRLTCPGSTFFFSQLGVNIFLKGFFFCYLLLALKTYCIYSYINPILFKNQSIKYIYMLGKANLLLFRFLKRQ